MKNVTKSMFVALLIGSQAFLSVGCMSLFQSSGSGSSGAAASSSSASSTGSTSTSTQTAASSSGSSSTSKKATNNFRNKIVPLGGKINAKTDDAEIRIVAADDNGQAVSTSDIKDATVVAVDDKGNETEVKPGDVSIAAEDAAEAAALRLSIVSDYSGSMPDSEISAMGKIQVDLLKSLPRIYEGELILFSSTVLNRVTWTNDIDKLLAGTERDGTMKRGATALYDAMGTSLQHLIDSKVASAKIMTLMTDGQENYSKTFTKEKLVSMVSESGVSVVMVGTKDADVDELKELAGKDGLFFYSDDYAGISAQMQTYFDSLNKMTKIKISGDNKNAKAFKIKAKGKNLQTTVRMSK